MRGHKNSSFTLIEIMVVVMIVGVVTAFAIPNYGRMVRKAELKVAWDNMVAAHTAEKLYFLNYGEYLPGAGQPPCDKWLAGCQITSIEGINRGLNLALVGDKNFYYGCSTWEGGCDPSSPSEEPEYCHPRCFVKSPPISNLSPDTFAPGGFALVFRMDIPISSTNQTKNPNCYGSAEDCAYFESLY